jgi:hypothetical protein
MAEPDGDGHVAALIESLATRTDLETDRLVALLRHRCWPGGLSDRTERPALEWVRRWGPARLTASAVDCSCPQGRCSVCN